MIHNLPNELLELQYQGTQYYLLLSTLGTPYFTNMKHSNMDFSATVARYFSESLRVHFLWRRLGQRTRQMQVKNTIAAMNIKVIRHEMLFKRA